jgi:hypothetical protein
VPVQVSTVIVPPVPKTVYQTPGEVTDVPQKGASGSIVAPMVVPAVTEGIAKGPIASVHKSALAIPKLKKSTQKQMRTELAKKFTFLVLSIASSYLNRFSKLCLSNFGCFVA